MLPPLIQQIPGWIALVFIIPLFWFLVGILILLWVYRDAESRGMNGVLWAIIVFFLNIFGLILYLIVRESRPGTTLGRPITRICPKCGQVLTEDAKFCPRCGKPLE
jgi:uncharacterized membrane protein YoaK (UPF0700 family)